MKKGELSSRGTRSYRKMHATKLRSVKKEIRILGLAVQSTCEDAYFQGIGVVYRGYRWFDGVMRMIAKGPYITDKLAEMIKLSPHHAQVRVLLMHKELIDNGAIFDPYTLSTATSRPLITLSKDPVDEALNRDEHKIPINSFVFEKDYEHIKAMAIGLPSREATEVLQMSTRDGLIPEALKVARLIASALAGETQQKI